VTTPQLRGRQGADYIKTCVPRFRQSPRFRSCLDIAHDARALIT
jgi:hypothetical protein